MLYGVKHRNLSAMVELNLGLMFSCVFFTAQVGHVNHTHTLHINNSQRKCKYMHAYITAERCNLCTTVSYVHFDSTD